MANYYLYQASLLKEKRLSADTRTAVNQDSLFHLICLSAVNEEKNRVKKEMIKILIEHGLNIHCKNSRGMTPIMFMENVDLLSYGANPLVNIPFARSDYDRRTHIPANVAAAVLNSYRGCNVLFPLFCQFGLGLIKPEKRFEAMEVYSDDVWNRSVKTRKSEIPFSDSKMPGNDLFFLEPQGYVFRSTPVNFAIQLKQAEICIPVESMDPNLIPTFPHFTSEKGPSIRRQIGSKGRRISRNKPLVQI